MNYLWNFALDPCSVSHSLYTESFIPLPFLFLRTSYFSNFLLSFLSLFPLILSSYFYFLPSLRESPSLFIFFQATDLEISAKLMLHTKETLNTYMAAFCEQSVDKLRVDTDRDFYMTPQEALSYGLIDEVIQHKNMIKTPKIPSLRVRI